MNESRIAPPGPIEFSSSTPSLIPTHELMERIYGSNNQSLNYINESLPEEEEFVEEEDLDDTPTSPNFDSTEAPPWDIPQAGASRPPIAPPRGKTKVQRVLKSNVWHFCYLNDEKLFLHVVFVNKRGNILQV